MKKSPLAQVKDRFSDKAGLVKAVRALAKDELFIDRVNEDTGLDHVSNAKLLRLHDTLTAVKNAFGTREKLIEAILTAEKRKDPGYKTRLEGQSTPRLWDHYRAAMHRGGTTVESGAVKAGTAAAPAKAEEKVEKKAKAAPKKAAAKKAEPAPKKEKKAAAPAAKKAPATAAKKAAKK